MSNLTSTLTVRMVDDVSKPAKTVAQALEIAEKEAKRVAAAMKDSGSSNRFIANLTKFGLAGRDIERVSSAWKSYSSSAKLAAIASDWTKSQVADVRRWESQTITALKNVQKEERAFAAAQKHAVEQAARGGGREHGGSHLWSPHGALGYVAGGAAGYVGAHSVFSVTEKGLEAGAEREHIRVGMRNAGVKPEDVMRAEEASRRAAKDAPNMSVSEIMELFKETRCGVQHSEEAFDLLPMLAKAASVLKGGGVDNARLSDLVKGASPWA